MIKCIRYEHRYLGICDFCQDTYPVDGVNSFDHALALFRDAGWMVFESMVKNVPEYEVKLNCVCPFHKLHEVY